MFINNKNIDVPQWGIELKHHETLPTVCSRKRSHKHIGLVSSSYNVLVRSTGLRSNFPQGRSCEYGRNKQNSWMTGQRIVSSRRGLTAARAVARSTTAMLATRHLYIIISGKNVPLRPHIPVPPSSIYQVFSTVVYRGDHRKNNMIFIRVYAPRNWRPGCR